MAEQKESFWHHHLGVSVPDLDAAIEWWGRVLNFQLEQRAHIPTIPADIAFVRNGPMRVEIFEAPDAAPLPASRRVPDEDIKTHGNKHVSFVCEDVDAVAAILRERDADIVWVKDFGGGKKNIFLRDNAGNLIEFVQGPPPESEQAQL